MKQIIYYIFIFSMAISLTACHDLDEPATTELTPDVFPQDSLQFLAVSGTAYAALRGNYSLDYWFMQTLSTDEAILPARGGNWYDNQNYMLLHYHTWTKDHGWTNGCWSWLARVIGTTNQAISILGEAQPDTDSQKKSTQAELKMIRALSYFMLMDLYGNIPLDTVYGDFTQHPTVERAKVFDFIEAEVKAAIPYLSTTTGTATYGRMTQYTAYALLAKMYLNAGIYAGTDRNNDCIAMCDKIISSGKFALEPRSTYLKMFYPNNGPTMKEFIFAIPYDPAATAFSGTNGYMYHARYDVPRSLKAKFSLPFTPSAPESTLPEFYAYFEDDANDIRNAQWLKGLQYLNDGVTPVTVTTTNLGYDFKYSGSDPSASYTYQVEITPDILLRYDPANFDLGNDEIAWNMGYRNIKFYPDASSTSRNQNNDVPVFRYSDIILMKAEAILRGGTPTLGDQALTLVNQLRANRTTSGDLGSVDLQYIYEERCREFVAEAWHRNDMIRFGTYEQSWGFKTDADPNKRIFPIPTTARTLNTQLQQNPGYQ
ncbi:MAG TPA: RagB/SusD family nutrient uptake outer membrane protein [Ohtaekwangia sp.]|uniref:RagB/SusD family nutrient uptake outer membrane protein n=1 Tax=Ohtaekwangia sp. TaxID=2066019 RepID=UPI002F936CDB